MGDGDAEQLHDDPFGERSSGLRLTPEEMRRRIDSGRYEGTISAAIVAMSARTIEQSERRARRATEAIEAAELARRHRATGRNGAGPTTVVSLRMDVSEYAVLEERAQIVGLTASALARNLIREGLRERPVLDPGQVVATIGRELERLRTALA